MEQDAVGKQDGRLSRRKAVEAISVLREARRLREQYEKVASSWAGQLRRYLEESGEDLIDGERGLRARLQLRKGEALYDVRAMPSALVVELQSLGLLAVNHKALTALREASQVVACDDAQRYVSRGEGTAAVIIEEMKRA